MTIGKAQNKTVNININSKAFHTQPPTISLQMCRNIRIKFLSCAYMYPTLKCLGKRVIQTNPSKFDEMLFSDNISADYV